MWSVLLLLCLAYTIGHADCRKVKIKVTNSFGYNIICKVDYSDDLIDKQMFTFELYGDDKLNSGRCQTEDQETEIEIPNTNKPFHFIRDFNASMSMKTWLCYLHIGYNKNEKKCSFGLNIVQDAVLLKPTLSGVKPLPNDNPGSATVEGYLEVNGVKSYTKPVGDKSLQEFAHYDFFDGELANISCHLTDSQLDNYLRLSYVTKANRKIKTKPINRGPVEIHIKLTTEYDGAYIDCNITDNDDRPTMFQVYRLTLFLNKTADKEALGFQVNGLTLTPTRGHGQSLFFKYNYYDGEELEILSLKNEESYGVFDCIIYGQKTPKDLQKYSGSRWKNQTIHFTTSLQNGEILLSCSVEYTHPYTTWFQNTSMNLVLLKLRLIPNAYSNSRPFITGLSWANILLYYRKSELTDMIVYEYDTENLSMICWSYYDLPRWEYKSGEVEGIINPSSEHLKISNKYYNNIQGVFKLTQDQNQAILKCVLPEKSQHKEKVTVRLIRRNSLDNIPNEATESTNGALLIGCGVVVVVIIVTGVAVYLHKRMEFKQNPEQQESYEILSNQNGTVPVSSQQSEVYATPFGAIENDTYSVPYTPATVEEMYAKPIPKHQRAQGVSYATLQFDKVDQVSPYATAYSTPSQDVKTVGENYVLIDAQATKNLNPQTVSIDDQNHYDVCNYTTSK